MVEIRLSGYGFFFLGFYIETDFAKNPDLSLVGIEIYEWLEENIGFHNIGWDFRLKCIRFKDETSAMAFKLMFPEACE